VVVNDGVEVRREKEADVDGVFALRVSVAVRRLPLLDAAVGVAEKETDGVRRGVGVPPASDADAVRREGETVRPDPDSVAPDGDRDGVPTEADDDGVAADKEKVREGDRVSVP
jgi:hypothetical protein